MLRTLLHPAARTAGTIWSDGPGARLAAWSLIPVLMGVCVTSVFACFTLSHGLLAGLSTAANCFPFLLPGIAGLALRIRPAVASPDGTTADVRLPALPSGSGGPRESWTRQEANVW
ncbi:hypothetical protein CU254_28835 [Amycolatopsis sp. AA4]|nr:hypothetical protein CU254_28835 [Amycolatopsis sp. AA4]EFL10005.1 predicted protein [Streptomyces sp. AA4]